MTSVGSGRVYQLNTRIWYERQSTERLDAESPRPMRGRGDSSFAAPLDGRGVGEGGLELVLRPLLPVVRRRHDAALDAGALEAQPSARHPHAERNEPVLAGQRGNHVPY